MFLISLYCNETNKLSGLYCSRQNVEKSSLENLKLITKTFPSVHQKILSASKSQRWQSFPTHVHKVSEDLLGGSAKLFYLQYFKWSVKKKKFSQRFSDNLRNNLYSFFQMWARKIDLRVSVFNGLPCPHFGLFEVCIICFARPVCHIWSRY